MDNSILRKIALPFLLVLFIAPVIATLLISSGVSAETKQYDGLQVFVMGVYNLPFLIVSFIGISVSRSLQHKSKESAATVGLYISIISSVIGTVLMFTWGISNQ